MFQLGSSAIHALNEAGLQEYVLVNGKHAAEAADLAHHSTGEGAVGQVLDALLGAIGAANVNTAIGVSIRSLFQSKIRLSYVVRAPDAVEKAILALTRLSSEFQKQDSVPITRRVLGAEELSSFPTES